MFIVNKSFIFSIFLFVITLYIFFHNKQYKIGLFNIINEIEHYIHHYICFINDFYH